jgi:hypothetical protein
MSNDVFTITDCDENKHPSTKRIRLVKPCHKVVRVVVRKGRCCDCNSTDNGGGGGGGDNGGGTTIDTQTITDIICSFFGAGTVFVYGNQFDNSNIYLNSDFINSLTVFYNGANRYLIYGTEWEYVRNAEYNVVGVKILLNANFTHEDVFVIAPDPKCSGSNKIDANIYPFFITSADFEPDGVTYIDSRIVNDNLTIFVNESNQNWLQPGPNTFTITSQGIVLNIPDFDANTQDWTIMIQKLNS